MPANLHEQLNSACKLIKSGGVIAYPTEAVFGLGCDPMNEHTVHRLSQIKNDRKTKATF